MHVRKRISLGAVLCAGLRMASAQHDHSQMAGMDHMQMDHKSQMNQAGMALMNEASGTSLNAQSWPMPMLMKKWGSWQTMFMATAFVVSTQQSGPRGHNKIYAPNWFMAAAGHRAGKGSVQVQLMFSLDPATVTQRRYPELFQTGETAFGKPIVDGQHPHDLIMGLAFQYARPLSERTIFEAYFAPVGDPALGPVAFPHRASAMELPQAALSHHWQDSTHIADEVVTVGIQHRAIRLEASGFHGAEPDENRWNIDTGAIDSWSGRISAMPSKNWVAQVSMGRLARPERQEPGDVVRATASVQYVRPLAGKTSWATSLIWGRNHNTFTQRDTNSYLLESVAPFRRRNFVTGRVELVDKDELFPEDGHGEHGPPGAFRIGAYTLGYTRDVELVRNLETGLGVNVTAYSMAEALKPFYGNRPMSLNVFLRIRLRPE